MSVGGAEGFADRLRSQMLAALELYAIALGDRLGLYRTLGDGLLRSSAALARELGLTERYVREWLEQQAVAGVLEVDDADAGPSTRRYRLPAAHAPALLDPTEPSYVAASLRSVAFLPLELGDVIELFRTGGGLEWRAVEYELEESRDSNRSTFERGLASWIRAAPSVHERLSDATGPCQVADVGCGAGWSSLAIADAYPVVGVHGVDANAHSIELARKHAREAGLAERVTFAVADAAHLEGGPYDLVCFFECLHDLPRPVDALRRARERLAPGGAVIVGDEKAAEAFTAPGDELERLLYA
jgi:hypothetical protein